MGNREQINTFTHLFLILLALWEEKKRESKIGNGEEKNERGNP